MDTIVIKELETEDLQCINGGFFIPLMTFTIMYYGDDMVQGFKDGWNDGHKD